MKLERFVKNKKQKRIFIGSMIGLFLILGGIKLYKTFAVYEVKKEFNILRGRIPEFAKGDINFQFLLDGIESPNLPTKTSGKLYEGYECNKEGVSVRWSNVDWAPTILGLTEKETSCTLKFAAKVPISNVNIGDYVAYTPSSTSYTITTDLTGYTSNQTINPSELNLWRVIRKNNNGTIDVVSEYISSKGVYFTGKTGYEKLVGSLNTIAAQYETPEITVGSRHMGYNGQTETVTVSIATTASWTTSSANPTSSAESITPSITNGDARESAGGGDYGYLTDYELVKNVIGRMFAFKPNTTSLSSYWLASRSYLYNEEYGWNYKGHFLSCYGDIDVDIGEELDAQSLFMYYHYSWQSREYGYGIRPIITLDSSLKVPGEMMGDERYLWRVN